MPGTFCQLGTFCQPGTFSKQKTKMTEISAKTTENHRRQLKMAANGGNVCKNDGKRQKMAKIFAFSQASDARHLNVSSALLALAIVNIQVTHYTIITVKYCRHASQTLSHCFRFSCCKHIGNCLKAVTKLSHKLSPSCRHQHHHNQPKQLFFRTLDLIFLETLLCNFSSPYDFGGERTSSQNCLCQFFMLFKL